MTIKDTGSHILTDHSYSLEGGRIMICLKYREDAAGFLLCVSDLFTKRCNWEDQNLQDLIGRSIKKHQDYALWSLPGRSSGEGDSQDGNFRLFYVEENYLKGGKIALPPSVKAPVRIQILWKDFNGDYHIEDDSRSEIIIPMELRIHKHICQVRHWFRRSQYYINVAFDCIHTLQLPDDLLCYQPINSKYEFSITGQMLMSDKKMKIYLHEKEDRIAFKGNPKYKNMIKIKEINENY